MNGRVHGLKAADPSLPVALGDFQEKPGTQHEA